MKSTEEKMEVYQTAINRIDDYFEYANESKIDREKVHEILAQLCADLEEHH